MSVKVTTLRKTAGSSAFEVTHDDASTVYVHEGHLFVANGSNQRINETIATYAPGKWDSAQVIED